MWLLSFLPAKATIKAFFKSWRPEMFALVAVVAVMGVGMAIIGHLYIKGQKDRIAIQSERITELTHINAQWKENYVKQQALREREQQSVLALQDHVAQIETHSANTEKQLAELRRTNEEIRNYLDQPIPDGLKRMLK